jgi:hypothetical protein
MQIDRFHRPIWQNADEITALELSEMIAGVTAGKALPQQIAD